MDWRPYTRNPAKFGLVYKDGKWTDPEAKIDGIEIFSGFWRQKDQIRKQVVLANNWLNKEIRMAYILDYVPWSWRDIVCICDHSLIGFKTEKIHKVCGKYARWTFRRQCLKCLNPYVVDNSHPYRDKGYCYNCLVGKYGVMSSDNFFTKVPRELTKLEDREVFDSPAFPSFDF